MQKTNNIQMTSSDFDLSVETFGDIKTKVYTQEEAYQVCQSAMDLFGHSHQQSKAIEEFLELSLELTRDNNVTNIIDELADANIMLMQMGLLFGHEKVVQRMFYKLDRLEQRMKDYRSSRSK